MSYKLVKFEKDYADEFNVYGMKIMTNIQLSAYLYKAEKANYPVELYFGSNEALNFEDFEDLTDSLEVVHINADTCDMIESKIGETFGWFPEDIGEY